jgi:hypothetical protein
MQNSNNITIDEQGYNSLKAKPNAKDQISLLQDNRIILYDMF